MTKMPRQQQHHAIIVFDDGETYAGQAYVIYLTSEELARIEDGEKVRYVVGDSRLLALPVLG